MIEIIEFARETFIDGERAITVATWALTFVTALDAKVGIRIYTRMTVLINTLSGKVRKTKPQDDTTTPEPRPAKTMNTGHFQG